MTEMGAVNLRVRDIKRVKTPTLIQMEPAECGAAALGIVLAYYGKFLTLESLRKACAVSRDGCRLDNMIRAAQAYGLKCKAYQSDLTEIDGHPVPMILFWRFNHFVVLEGVRGDKIYLNDPSHGPLVVSQDEFDRAYTGVLLSLEPTEGFEPYPKKTALWRSLLPRLKGSGAALVFVIIAGIGLASVGLIAPLFSLFFLDEIFIGNHREWLLPLLIGMGLVTLLQWVFFWLQRHYLMRLEIKISLTQSARFFHHLLHLPIPFFAQRMAGDLDNRLSLNDRVAALLSDRLASIAVQAVGTLMFLVAMLFCDVTLASVCVVTAILNLLILRFTAEKRISENLKLIRIMGRLMGTSMHGLAVIETLKASGTESDFFIKWSGLHARVLNAFQELGRVTNQLFAFPPFLMALNGVLVLWLGSHKIIEGQLTIGTLVAFQGLMAGFLAPIQEFVNFGAELQNMQGELSQLDDILNVPVEQVSQENPTQVAALQVTGEMVLRGVSFGFVPWEAPILQDIDLHLKPGARVAIVGRSGCGKTSLASLVAGLYQPTHGELAIDGRHRSAYLASTLHQAIAFVNQDIVLFEGTIAENLSLWDKTIPEGLLVQAVKDACIYEELCARGGLQAQVSEGGMNFSGGQRQRLEIARALATNPAVLILDEATSALDAQTESQVEANLRARGCSCLVVAHRLSTVRNSDEIVVLEAGRIVQRGTHQQLAVVPGVYRELIKTFRDA